MTERSCALDFDFDEKRLHVSSEVSTGELLWTAFLSYTEGERAFLLYTAPGRFLVIPKHSLDEAEVNELRTLLRDRISTTGIPSTTKLR
jgi:hypothetical protein